MCKIWFLGFFVICFIKVSAQSDFRPGFVITNSMDTLYGFVDYRGEMRNMKVCTFKDSMDGSSTVYLPGEIHGYRYNTGKFFVSKAINTKDLNDTVFVEFLLKGITNLYYFKSLSYSAYFYDSEETGILELRSDEVEVKKDGKNYTGQGTRYLGVLNYALSDCPEIRRDVFKTDLSHKSLIGITRKYHDYKCSDEVCIIYEKKLPVLKIELKPLGGYSLSNITFRTSELEHLDFRMSSSSFAGLAMNFIVPRWNEKLTFQMNMTFNKDYFYASHQYSSNYTRYHYHINSSNITGSFLFKYTYPKYQFRPELFVGFYTNSMFNRESKVVSERRIGDDLYSSEVYPDLIMKSNKGITGGMGFEYELLKKIRGFSNVTWLHGFSLQHQEIQMMLTSYRFTTGLIF